MAGDPDAPASAWGTDPVPSLSVKFSRCRAGRTARSASAHRHDHTGDVALIAPGTACRLLGILHTARNSTISSSHTTKSIPMDRGKP